MYSRHSGQGIFQHCSSSGGGGASLGSGRSEAAKPTAAARPVRTAKLPEKTSMTMRWGLGEARAVPNTWQPKGVKVKAARAIIKRMAGVLGFTFFLFGQRLILIPGRFKFEAV
jgi:hypothetical protein